MSVDKSDRSRSQASHHQGHFHGHAHGHAHGHGGSKDLGLAFFLNLTFAVIELVGGLFTNSLAIISDAFHDMGDCLAIALAWFLERKSKSQSSHDFSYGLKRLSLLSAFITGTILVIGAVIVISNAIPRLLSPQMPNTAGMLWLAILGIAVNGFAAYRMKGTSSLNERMVYLHLLEDVLGWIAVLVGALVMIWKPWPLIDPVLAIGISLWVLWNAIANLKHTVQIFLQGSPMQFSQNQVEEFIREMKWVRSIHHTHIWSLDGEHHILTTHLTVEQETGLDQVHDLKCQIKKKLFDEFHIQEATIEVEWPHQQCADPKH